MTKASQSYFKLIFSIAVILLFASCATKGPEVPVQSDRLPPQQKAFEIPPQEVFAAAVEHIESDLQLTLAFKNENDFRFSTTDHRIRSSKGPIKYRVVGSVKMDDQKRSILTLYRQAELLTENVWIPVPSNGIFEAKMFQAIEKKLGAVTRP